MYTNNISTKLFNLQRSKTDHIQKFRTWTVIRLLGKLLEDMLHQRWEPLLYAQLHSKCSLKGASHWASTQRVLNSRPSLRAARPPTNCKSIVALHGLKSTFTHIFIQSWLTGWWGVDKCRNRVQEVWRTARCPRSRGKRRVGLQVSWLLVLFARLPPTQEKMI